MADILEGTSDHMNFAPLTTGQTRAVCKHLQDQLDDLHSKFHSLEKEKDHANSFHSDLIRDVDQDRGRVNDLKNAVASTKRELDGLKKDIQQARISTQRIQSSLDNTNDNLGQLRDTHSKTELIAQGAVDGLERTNTTLKEFRHMVESRLQADMENLREDWRKADYDIDALKITCGQMKADAKAQLENLRATDAMARSTVDNLARTDKSLDKLAQKANDLKKNLASTQKNMDGTRGGLLKLQDHQMRMASAVGEMQGGLKRLNDDAKSHKEQLKMEATNLGSKHDQLHTAIGTFGNTKENMARLEAMIVKLKSSFEVLAAKNEQLASQLEQTDIIARGVKTGLDQTNAVVLPNLALDPHVFSSHDFARTRTPRPSPRAAFMGEARSISRAG